MPLNGHYALYCTKDVIFGAYHENFNEGQQQKCRLGTLVSGNIRFMRTFAGVSGFLDRRRQTTVWLSITALFSDFAGYTSSETSEIRPALLHSDTQSLVGFPLNLEHWSRMTLNGYFTLNSVFAPVCLERFSLAFENDCVKMPLEYYQRQTCSFGTLVSGNIRFMRYSLEKL